MVAASVLWSFGGLCIKFIPWSAMTIVGLRAFLAAAVFAVYRKSVKVELTRGNVLASLCLSLTTIFFVFANKLTTAAGAILLQFSAPIFIILLEFALYKKKPRPSAAIAVGTAILGMVLLFADSLEIGSIWGSVMAILSGLTFAGVFICNNRPDTDPKGSLYMGLMINAVVGLPFAFFEVTPDPLAWGASVFLGIVQVGLAYVLFSIGIKRTPALLACLISGVEPVLSPIWVALGTGETPGRFTLLGGAVILTAVVGYNLWLERSARRAVK